MRTRSWPNRTPALSLAVLLFPNFFQDFTLVNDLGAVPALAADDRIASKWPRRTIRSCRLHLRRWTSPTKRSPSAWAGHLPTLSVDMFYGIDANQFAKRGPRWNSRTSATPAAATLNIPVWNWGATQSKVRQAELQRHQAQVELSAAQRQAVADLQSFYARPKLAYQLDHVLRADCRISPSRACA